MAHNVILPKLGTNMTEALIVQWLKQEGDEVSSGDPLLEVETEKANYEVEAESPGVLRHILAQAGETVQVAVPVAVIGLKDEDLTGHLQEIELQKKSLATEERYTSEVYRQWESPTESLAAPDVKEEGPSSKPAKRAAASPAARRLAKELGVDLSVLASSLSEGSIIQEEDVRQAAKGTPITIFGAGLGAAQVMDVLRFLPQYRLVAIVDDNESLWENEIRGYPVYGVEALKDAVESGEVQAVAVSLHSEHRRRVSQRLKEACPGISFPALVHPDAYIGQDVVLEEGVLVEAGATIGTGTVVREGAIVDMGVVISHHCDVGAFSHLAPRSTLSGAVKVGEHSVIMTGAVVANTATIGKNTVITPGSVVASDSIPDDVVVQGNPARVVGKSKRGL